MMRVREAIESRRSVRDFLSDVNPAVLMDVLQTAPRSPSANNLQPWKLYVLSGERLEQLKQTMRERLTEAPQGALKTAGRCFRKLLEVFWACKPNEVIYAGLQIGHARPGSSVNQIRSARAPLEQIVTFLGEG